MALRDVMSDEEFKAYRRGIVRRSQQKRRLRAGVRTVEQRDQVARRLKHKRILVALLGGRCLRCRWEPRTDADFAAMDFHHRNPREKAFEVCARLPCSLTMLTPEAQKCDLLCAKCHRIVEAELDTTRIAEGRAKHGNRRGRKKAMPESAATDQAA